eukprot:superscaffoldBa00010344_g24658
MGSPGGPKVCGSASIHMRRSQLLYQRFLTDAAAGLTFSHDIMAELDADSTSYNQADFRQLFRPTGVLEPAAKRTTQDRKLSRLPPRPKNPQVLPRLLGFRGLLQSVDRSPPRPQGVQLLQSSSTGNRGTAVTGDNHYVEEASGSGKPVQKVAHQSHDQITSDDSKYHINQQRRSSPAPDTMTTHANKKHLNRSEYRTRLLACNTLSGLKWPINKDVVHKLTHLMCNDQSYLVCLAAAETLMTLGKVQDVHNEL